MFSRIINWFLVALFGRDHEGSAKVMLFSGSRDAWYEGRWSLRWVNDRRRSSGMSLEWNLWTHFCSIAVRADGEDGGTKIHAAFPPFSLWLTLPFGPKKHSYSNHVYFDFSIHNNAFWWQFGGDSMSWDSKTPKWKRGCFHFDDFFLGKSKFSEEVLDTRNMVIRMPEGDYKAVGTLERCTWKRPRWFAKVRTYISVKIDGGIPFEGKGENSWDCGEDGLFGYSYEGDSWSEASDAGTMKVLNNRKKYNGNRMAKYPDPALREFKKTDNSDLNTLLAQAGKGPTPAT